MRRLVLAIAALFVVYFPVAFYLKRSDEYGFWLKPLTFYGTATPGVYAAAMWMPVNCFQAVIYENGRRIGVTNNVVDHPHRAWILAGRRWKFIEFNLDHSPKGNSYQGLACD